MAKPTSYCYSFLTQMMEKKNLTKNFPGYYHDEFCKRFAKCFTTHQNVLFITEGPHPHGLWDLKKTGLRKIHISRTV